MSAALSYDASIYLGEASAAPILPHELLIPRETQGRQARSVRQPRGSKSGLWVFISLLPVIGPFWAFIEPAFYQGTEGPNEFDEVEKVSYSIEYLLAADDPLLSAPPIVGRQCAHCQQQIVSFIGAGPCNACQEPLHHDCSRAHLANAHMRA